MDRRKSFQAMIQKVSSRIYKPDSLFRQIEKSIHSRNNNSQPLQILKKKDKFLEYLKNQHRVKEGFLNIMGLPKNAYGVHPPYKSESEFTDRHFSRNHSQLDSMKMKFELFTKRNRSKTHKKLFKSFDHHYFPNPAGNLICKRARSVELAYEQNKQSYSGLKEYYKQINHKESPTKRESRSTKRFTLKSGFLF